MNILYELNNSFGDIWDPATQTDCFREIMRLAPGFDAPLRDIMQYNILAVERGSAPREVYLGRLDTAGQYAEKLTAYHDALKSYWAQRLRAKLGIPGSAPILPLLSRY